LHYAGDYKFEQRPRGQLQKFLPDDIGSTCRCYLDFCVVEHRQNEECIKLELPPGVAVMIWDVAYTDVLQDYTVPIFSAKE
jgi:hypothetical protein